MPTTEFPAAKDMVTTFGQIALYEAFTIVGHSDRECAIKMTSSKAYVFDDVIRRFTPVTGDTSVMRRNYKIVWD